MPAPRDLVFYGDIDAELGSCTAACHTNRGQAGVPVRWTEAQPFGTQPAVTNPQPGYYEQVMARINIDHIEDSPIVKKAAGAHRFGGQRTGYDSSLDAGAAGRSDYDMFVNWIAEGAPCGGTAAQCVR